jgi:hypothetical protein
VGSKARIQGKEDLMISSIFIGERV